MTATTTKTVAQAWARTAIAALVASSALAAVPATAGVVQRGDVWSVSYGVDLWHGTSNGMPVTDVVIFETDGTNSAASVGHALAADGVSWLRHDVAFAPTRTLIAGIGRGVAGVGDGADHIYMITDVGFGADAVGFKWSEVFPGQDGVRVRHNQFIGLLDAANDGDADALAAVWQFVRRDAAAAWFDTTGAFSALEFTVVQPPIGGNVPVPATFALAALALAACAAATARERSIAP